MAWFFINFFVLFWHYISIELYCFCSWFVNVADISTNIKKIILCFLVLFLAWFHQAKKIILIHSDSLQFISIQIFLCFADSKKFMIFQIFSWWLFFYFYTWNITNCDFWKLPNFCQKLTMWFNERIINLKWYLCTYVLI